MATITEAQQAAEEAQQTLARWQEHKRTAQARLEAMEAGGAAAVLAGESTPADKARELTDLRKEIELLDVTIQLAERQLVHAQGQVLLAQAEAKRTEAEALQATVQERQARQAELLKPLEEFEGCRFEPVQAPRDTSDTRRWGLLAGTDQLGPATRTYALAEEARSLESQALQLERRAVQHILGEAPPAGQSDYTEWLKRAGLLNLPTCEGMAPPDA
jgi:hypothetical protein